MSKKYSLLVDINGETKVIRINEYDAKKKEVLEKNKVDLATIDLLTTCFSNEEELKKYFELPSNSKLKITYASQGILKQLPLIFDNNNLMRHFSYLSYASSSLDENGRLDPTFRTVLNRFFYLICHSSIREAILRDPKINLYLKDKIRDYLEFSGNEQFILKKIEKELLNYKNLRSVVLCLKKYEEDKQKDLITFEVPSHDEVLPPNRVNLSRFIPDDYLEEPLFPVNSEEENEYDKYMDSLPIENFEKDFKEQNDRKTR